MKVEDPSILPKHQQDALRQMGLLKEEGTPAQRASVSRSRSKAKRGGSKWENELRELHRGYVKLGRAAFHEFAHPYTVLRRGPAACDKCGTPVLRPGEFRGRLTGLGPPDMTLLVGRWAYLCEAKRTSGDRFSLSLVKPHQAEAFDGWCVQPVGRALVLLYTEQHGRWAIPWSRLRPIWRRWYAYQERRERAPSGTGSLSLADLRTMGVEFDMAKGWLPAAIDGLLA